MSMIALLMSLNRQTLVESLLVRTILVNKSKSRLLQIEIIDENGS